MTKRRGRTAMDALGRLYTKAPANLRAAVISRNMIELLEANYRLVCLRNEESYTPLHEKIEFARAFNTLASLDVDLSCMLDKEILAEAILDGYI